LVDEVGVPAVVFFSVSFIDLNFKVAHRLLLIFGGNIGTMGRNRVGP
jgi:hypothetical protein